MPLLQAFLALCLLAAAHAGEGDNNAAVLQLPTDADAVSVAAGAALDFTVFPTNGTLLAGQDLNQAERLYSSDSSVFLVPQTDGNLVLYNAYAVQQMGGTSPLAAIWNSGTYNNGGPQPFVLAMQQDCNLVLYNGNAANGGPRNAGDAVFETATYNEGTPPCNLTVSDAGPGGFVVVDSAGSVLFSTLRVLHYPNVTDLATGAAIPVGGQTPYSIGAQQTRLHSGAVLVSGGSNPPGPVTPMTISNASLFSPATLSFAPAAPMTTSRAYHSLVTTSNGTALAIGGLVYVVNSVNGARTKGLATSSIEAYNPFTNTWSNAGTGILASGIVSVVLPSGLVLSAGGYSIGGPQDATSVAALFDPMTGTTTFPRGLAVGRAEFQMIVLADGSALACGGLTTHGYNAGDESLFSCERFFPANGTWAPTGNLTTTTIILFNGQPYALPWINFILSLLPNGQVLASASSNGCSSQLSLFDPAAGTWSALAPSVLFAGSQILLPTGELLLGNAYSVAQCNSSGAPTPTNPTNVAALYNPLTGSARFSSLPVGYNSILF